MAELLEISPSYLSQLEHDYRPLTPKLTERLARHFALDWQDIGDNETEQLTIALRQAVADPIFEAVLAPEDLTRLAEQQPTFAKRFVTLHDAYRRTIQRLEMLDETVSVESMSSARLPWEEVRDWFHVSNNYVDQLDRAAEGLAHSLTEVANSPSHTELERYLSGRHDVKLDTTYTSKLREFDPRSHELRVDSAQGPAGVRFQLAHQLVALSLRDTIDQIAVEADLRSSTARELLKVGLANYAAGALVMPYERFRNAARTFRHDIDRISQAFGTSFEQTCHRLSTLQRKEAKGVPVFFCRVDMAGNITKRHSATRLQFARFGGACPLWIVHEAVAIPDRVLVQLAETPDGARYISMAKGLVKPSGSFERMPRRYAVALGCEVEHADRFVYADGLDLGSERASTKIGISCRICPREDCDQRAYPPSDQTIVVDPYRRGIVPYELQMRSRR